MAIMIRERQKEWALKAAAGIAVLVFCFFLIVYPAFRNIVVLRQTILDSQKRSGLYQMILELNKSIDEGESALMVVADRSLLLGKIADIASRSKLSVGALTPRTEPDGAYIKLKIEMDGTGSFFSLLKFLDGIEKFNPSLKAKDVVVSRQSSTGLQEEKNLLQIHVEFETFLKQRVKKKNA